MTQKIFISDNNRATFICPSCNASKEADVSKYKGHETIIKLKVKCACGNAYVVTLERRKFYRKETNLPGIFIYNPSNGPSQKGTMTVLDISRGGLKFKTKVLPKFNTGVTVEVEFNLDNKNRTLINKKALIKNIRDVVLSAEFRTVDTYDPSEKALAFYLF